jgi:hypothetical protein
VIKISKNTTQKKDVLILRKGNSTHRIGKNFYTIQKNDDEEEQDFVGLVGPLFLKNLQERGIL